MFAAAKKTNEAEVKLVEKILSRVCLGFFLNIDSVN